MRENDFRAWLKEQGYGVGTISSRVSNCLRVCRDEDDLDKHYQTDRCASLLARLTYTTADEREETLPRHRVSIEGNIRNGTAALKQAVGLYLRFLEERGALNPQASSNESNQTARNSADTHPVLDSYAQFLDYFGLDKNAFYSFGLDNTVFADASYAEEQWAGLKQRLLENMPITMRRYGRQNSGTELFRRLYAYLFANNRVLTDLTGNAAPKRNLQAATGHRVNDTLYNYQCAHIFGRTKNPLLFEAVWNICFVPRIFDPLTGHEAKGAWPTEYQELLHQFVQRRFKRCICDYNSFLVEYKLQERIAEYVAQLAGEYDEDLIKRFKEDALSEWATIKISADGS